MRLDVSAPFDISIGGIGKVAQFQNQQDGSSTVENQ